MGRAGEAFEISPASREPWAGVFPSPKNPVESPLTFIAHPDGVSFGVVSEGTGCVVNAHNPHEWHELPLFGISDVVRVEDPPMVIYVGIVNIAAYGASGLKWKTERLSYDGVLIDGISHGRIHGRRWDAPKQAWTTFAIDVRDGPASMDELLNILKATLSAGPGRPELITKFQNLVWSASVTMGTDTLEYDVLNTLALDLDYYEQDEEIRREDPSFYGDDRLHREITEALEQLERLRSR